jgi:CRP-like cAMP-binding protein
MLLSENGSQSARVRAPGLVTELPPSPCETCQVRKSNFCRALSGDRDDWVALRGQHRSTAARHTVYRAGEASEGVLLICDGWAVRFVQLPNGKRQILSVLLPGDMASPIPKSATATYRPPTSAPGSSTIRCCSRPGCA